MQQITLAGGCFWCIEAAYQLINGVAQAVPGYAGGQGSEPSYHSIHGSSDGWAEAVQVSFDPEVISLDDILDIFWTIHDPTTPNRQGPDIGPEYRSMILYADDEQKKIAEASRDKAQAVWGYKIVTEIVPLGKFYEAEEEHHNFFQRHPEQAYCVAIINPKLDKLRTKFAQKLKA